LRAFGTTKKNQKTFPIWNSKMPIVDEQTIILDLKKRLAKAHRICTAAGLWPLTKGHISARIPNTDRVLVLGHIHSEGRSLIDTNVDDIVTVDIEGNWIEGRIEPVEERYLHLEIMRDRPEIMSCAHTHSHYATAFGIAGVHIIPVGNRGAIFAPHVPILDFDKQIDTPERGRLLSEAMGESCAIVLKNHGIAAAADSIENATITAFALEETAHLQWTAAQIGTPQKLSSGEVHSVLTGNRKIEFYDHIWGHYAALDPWKSR